ncbi:MAG: hypothetical protein ACEPOZ_21060 [Marinifilaceae bacterium]
MTKIQIPRKEEDLLQLVLKISLHHESHPKRSPLNAAFNMDRIKRKLQIIKTYKESIPQTRNEAINSREKRRQEIRFISREVKSIGHFLQTIYPDEPQTIRDWGFNIEE